MMETNFITDYKKKQFKGVAGLRIGNDPPHPAPPDFAQDQASVPGYKRFSAKSPSSSQPDIKINSSIAINVTDLKHKIHGLEHQLNDVHKHCQGLACLDTSSGKDCPTLVDTEDGTELASLKDQSEVSSFKNSSTVQTKLLYKSPEGQYTKSDETGCSGNVYDDRNSKHTVKSDEMTTEDYASKKNKKRKSKLDARLKAADGSQPNLQKHKTQSVYENFVSNVETSSYHSLVEPRFNHGSSTAYSEVYPEKKHKNREMAEPLNTNKNKVKKRKDQVRRNSPESLVNRESKHKHKIKTSRDLDQDYIAEIIKRQYRPVKMFGKRESVMSQISAPVCRDQEFTIREDIVEGSELCSCCVDKRKKRKHLHEHQLQDKRSVCDARLYSSKKHVRHRSHHKEHAILNYNDIYNDSEQYDLIPVKEKSSPKSRRKMYVDATIPYNCYKEVPPSPRTHRPRLNLKAYNIDTEFKDYMMHRRELRHRNYSPHRHKTYLDDIKSIEASDMLEYYKTKHRSHLNKKSKIEKHVQYDAGIMNHLTSPLYQNEPNNVTNDNSLNKTQDSDTSGDKTDKALSEIKDILQTFLQEIKKEATSGSQCGHSDIMTGKTGDKCLNEFRPSSTKLNTSIMPESGICVNGFGIPQNNIPSPFISPFTNPCCYPILPVCPMNCMQNGLILPSPSCTCNCVNHHKDVAQSSQKLSNETNAAKTGTETEELIKEIYKVVAQNPNNDLHKGYSERKEISSPKETATEKMLTSRSAGDSLRISKRDAEVATHKVKCHSRSCEAIGSRMTSDTYYSRTNPTYSDTVLERLSLEATASSSETASSSGVTNYKKGTKNNKIAKVLRSFGLLKKKKDVIEEVSESESTVEISIEPKPPFRQEITDYAMHSQEYYHRPPVPTHFNNYHSSSMDYQHDYDAPPHCHHVCPAHTSPRSYSMYDSNINNRSHAYRTGSPRRSPRPHPSAPPYPNPYDYHHHHSQPQVPLCLKEVEVKSIGTQSERKLPLFWKFGRKLQAPMAVQTIEENGAKNNFTQTAEKPQPKLLPAKKLANINWKALQSKVNELDKPNSFSYKEHKKLAEGDMKMRNAMLKKLFYKRNPFSPRNLIVRTILGKDKSSYGDAPFMYRPRMFI